MVNDRLCTVCGYEMEDGPRDFNICPSCGTEFGLHDFETTIAALRAGWLLTGPQWHSTVAAQPSDWNPIRQLTALFLNPSQVFVAAPSYTSNKRTEIRYRRKRGRSKSYSGLVHSGIGLSPQEVRQKAA